MRVIPKLGLKVCYIVDDERGLRKTPTHQEPERIESEPSAASDRGLEFAANCHICVAAPEQALVECTRLRVLLRGPATKTETWGMAASPRPKWGGPRHVG